MSSASRLHDPKSASILIAGPTPRGHRIGEQAGSEVANSRSNGERCMRRDISVLLGRTGRAYGKRPPCRPSRSRNLKFPNDTQLSLSASFCHLGGLRGLYGLISSCFTDRAFRGVEQRQSQTTFTCLWASGRSDCTLSLPRPAASSEGEGGRFLSAARLMTFNDSKPNSQ